MDISLVNRFNQDNLIMGQLDKLLNWARAGSQWYFQF